MSTFDRPCSMGHTNLYPEKNEVRTLWHEAIPITSRIFTLSHAVYDVLNIRRHQGPIHTCDMDPVVIQRARYLRLGDPHNSKPGRYPRLDLQPELQGDLRHVIPNVYLPKFGATDTGAWDLDLTGTVDQVLPIVQPAAWAIRAHKPKRGSLFLVTYRNGRDSHGWNAHEKRVECLAEKLDGVTYAWHRHYRSDYIGRMATRERGSSMTIVAFKF